MKTLSYLKFEMDEVLRGLGEAVACSAAVDATIVCIPRHGFGTTRISVESLYAATDRRFNVIYVDVNSPPAVRSYLEKQVVNREGFFHLRIDEYVSRQTARLLAMEMVRSPYVAFLDNNMLLSPGWLGSLLDAAAETGAAMVSPIIVTHGGEIHFSAGFVEKRHGKVVRPHFQAGGPVCSKLADARVRRMDIDFAESHGCLAETAAIRTPGVLKESLHNAQTLCCAAYNLKRNHGRRIVMEPTAVVSIVPISFGYDLPWMCLSYMDRDLLAGSYRELVSLMGSGPSTDLAHGLRWHAMHFKYLLTTLLQDGRLTRPDLLATDEISEGVRGYDRPLAKNTDAAIREEVLPHVEEHLPQLAPLLAAWLAH